MAWAQFLITYDNHSPRSYDSLYALWLNGKAERLAESVWLANLKGPASEVRKFVISTLQNDDTVAVLELKPGSDWATANVSAAANTWLSAYIAQRKKRRSKGAR